MSASTRLGGTELKPWQIAVTVVSIGIVLVGGDRPLVDAMVIAGIGIVAPLALGGATSWSVATPPVALALVLDPGILATVLVVPALIAAGRIVLGATTRDGSVDLPVLVARLRSVDTAAAMLAPVWGLVAVISLMSSTAGLELFGIGEPIVLLTAIHYLYAGVGALTIARRLDEDRTLNRTLTIVAVAATGVAPAIVAAGFVLGHPLPQIGGAVLMTLGVWAAAAALLTKGLRATAPRDRVMLTVAGLTPWVPMVLAVAWATAQHVADAPAMSIPDMARFHGLTNGLGFVLLGLLATTTRISAPQDGPAPTRTR